MLLQGYLEHLGYKAQIHFELEGCYQARDIEHGKEKSLDYKTINHCLRQLDIDGEIIEEYWRHQWEYVSLFNGQSPLKEALNLSRAIEKIPQLFQQLYSKDGVTKTLIQPVVWCGDQGKLADGSEQIFTHDTRAVHIPNAVQLNVSVINTKGENLLAEHGFGEYLQDCFLQTSLECCLLYLPEEAAFERLALKTRYGLVQELCSPNDISGGHQGSIALYRERGKHNQNMGERPLLYDQYNSVLSVIQNWQETARIEHRLGASSVKYNPYVNVIYALLNVVDAVHEHAVEQKSEMIEKPFSAIALPTSLYGDGQEMGAVELFQQSCWFSQTLNCVQKKYNRLKLMPRLDCPSQLGDKIKQAIVENYHAVLAK
ncbi:MAG: hypothetical protein OQK09_12640 [Colwellia sp.]|nr:hypothetical protein [Colwellia sp.]MCW8865957.1 hypothetical protein [Colwellia sp.]MCW9082352.1 hypothetical protein [Colwellia sp.]